MIIDQLGLGVNCRFSLILVQLVHIAATVGKGAVSLSGRPLKYLLQSRQESQASHLYPNLYVQGSGS